MLLVENASGNAVTDEIRAALEASITELRFLPKHATYFCQQADSSVICNVKTAWRGGWENKTIQMVTAAQWTDWKKGSGKLENPGKLFFLSLALQSIHEVASIKDSDDMLNTRKAMIRCGVALNVT